MDLVKKADYQQQSGGRLIENASVPRVRKPDRCGKEFDARIQSSVPHCCADGRFGVSDCGLGEHRFGWAAEGQV